jgi:flagellar motility protein MotE (MotC chaperone)
MSILQSIIAAVVGLFLLGQRLLLRKATKKKEELQDQVFNEQLKSIEEQIKKEKEKLKADEDKFNEGR